RFLGHYVVGGLARGLEATVELARSPVQGITARVLLPESLLAHLEPKPGLSTKDTAGVVNGATIARKSLPASGSAPLAAESPLRPSSPASTARRRAEPDVSMSGR